MNFLFILYGAVIILIDAFAVWKPRVWVEWTERHFIYRRERIVAGSFFLLLGLVPIYWIMGLAGWQFYVLSVLSGIWIIIGTLMLAFPDSLRNLLLSLGYEKSEIKEMVDMGFFNAFFIIGRTIGFMGHYFDQKRLGERLYRHPWDDILYDVPDKPEIVE